MTSNGQTMTELDTFLPQDGSNIKEGIQHGNVMTESVVNKSPLQSSHPDNVDVYIINGATARDNENTTSVSGAVENEAKRYKVTVSPAKKLDVEDGKGYWDPFKERHTLPNATTDCDTVTHLLKAALGTGILAMPVAFKFAGMTVGIFSTILVSLVCTHCSYVLVKCAHELYHRTKVTSMSFADVGEVAFASGPSWGKKFSKIARISILAGLFAAYFGTCSVYTVLISENIRQVVEHNLGMELNERLCIASLLVPLVVLCWVPNLKKLAPISMVANFLMAASLLITFYYLVWDLRPVSELPQVGELSTIPGFFSITIFAMEAIGVVMPLENAMKTPQHFIGICGVLNRGMGGVTLIYILLGFLGYLKYGDETKDSITLNLPVESIAAQVVKVFVGIAVYCTYGLQYFVCLEIVWNGVKDRFKKNSQFGEYIVRTLLTTSTVILAVAVPTIGPFLGLIGALCFSFLGLIIPVFIEFVTYWDVGFGPGNWVVWKNILVLIFGVLALVFGSYTSILDIVRLYAPKHELLGNSTGINNSTESASDFTVLASSMNLGNTSTTVPI